MNTAHKLLITLGVAIVLVLIFYVIASTITRLTGYVVTDPINDKFADCLEEQDITLYINSDEPANILRNSEVIDYLDNIKIMNCLRNSESCDDLSIINYPTWLINNQIIAGELTLEDLSKYSGCDF